MNATLNQIRERLQHVPMKWEPSDWLDTGIPDLNLVLGNRDKGVPYGKMIEISGWESQGKTAIMMALAALAQMDGALIIWIDAENSFDPAWAAQRGFAKCPKCSGTGELKDKPCTACGGRDRVKNTYSKTCGLDTDKLILIYPYVGKFSYKDKFGKSHMEKTERLSSAQELISEGEECLSACNPRGKKLLVVDSVASLLTEGEAAAGVEDANLRSDMDLPKFMSRLLRRWVGRAQVYNTIIILINQLREGPSKGFGNTAKTPGGNAPKFYSHVRIRVARAAKGSLRDAGKVQGFCGIMKALKNKSGGEEYAEVGFRLWYRKPLEFVPAKDVRKLAEE